MPRPTTIPVSSAVILTEGLSFYGLAGLWIESYGNLVTDIYGLSTATSVYVARTGSGFTSTPRMLSPHPVWNFMHLEKRTITIDYGFTRFVCEYAGFEGAPVPIIEWSSGVSSEPIETHPDFENFAGTPSSPNNGAVFLDTETQKITNDNTKGKFAYFRSDTGNDFAGVTTYLSPYKIKRETRLQTFPLSTSNVGQKEGNMLVMAISSTQRGIVYQNTKEWRDGGRRGINPDIYT
jgi:hypothetical protein